MGESVPYTPENLEYYYRLREQKAKEIREAHEKEKEARQPPRPVEELKGKKVTIHLFGGGEIVGMVKQVSKYELVVQGKGNRDLVVFKHAIMYVEAPPQEKPS